MERGRRAAIRVFWVWPDEYKKAKFPLLKFKGKFGGTVGIFTAIRRLFFLLERPCFLTPMMVRMYAIVPFGEYCEAS